MTNNKMTQPLINKRRYFSPIWLLPMVAALMGAWLMFQSIENKGSEISIYFSQTSGIKPGKTKVRYKGLEIGEVIELTLDDKLQGVNVVASIKPQAKRLLRTGTQFWLVSPKASLAGISGLDTLVSGNYIDVLPGEGQFNTQFEALNAAPALKTEDGFPIQLRSQSLGSLSVGTAVYFKQIQVGKVHDFKLSNNHEVLIDLIIEKQYANLVKTDSRFWNISGLHAKLSTQGLQVDMNGLASLISGGIAFDSPKSSKQAQIQQSFHLYPNISSSQRGKVITLALPKNHGLKQHSKLLFNDLEIGELTEIYLNEQGLAQATLLVDPLLENYFTEQAEIYLLKPSFNFNEVKNLSNILTGNHLGLKLKSNANSKQAKNHFVVSPKAPLPYQGISLKLTSSELKNIQAGSKVSYLGYTIGQVIATHIDQAKTGIEVELLIKQEHQALIDENSRFYIHSPLNIKASLEGVSIESGGLANYLKGEVVLIRNEALRSPKDKLYLSKEAALFSSSKNQKDLKFTLVAMDKQALIHQGAKLYFKGMEIGYVHSKQLKNNQLQYQVQVHHQYRHLIQDNSVFWYKSPIHFAASLRQVKMELSPLSGLLKGGIEMAHIEGAKSKNKQSHYPLFANSEEARSPKVAINFTLDEANKLSAGAHIRYKGISIGKLEHLQLSDDGQKLQAKAYLHQQYAHLFTHQNSSFWLEEPKISLNEVKNIGSIVTGSYIQASPGKRKNSGKLKTVHNFKVLKQAPYIEANGLKLLLSAKQKASINVGSPLLFRQLQVGEITHIKLSAHSDKLIFTAEIQAQYAHLIRENTKFWNVSGINIDIGLTGGEIKAESLNTILNGGIAFSSPNGQAQKVKSHHRFILYQEPEKSWLDWDPKIKK